jgi:hypothetical protein
MWCFLFILSNLKLSKGYFITHPKLRCVIKCDFYNFDKFGLREKMRNMEFGNYYVV